MTKRDKRFGFSKKPKLPEKVPHEPERKLMDFTHSDWQQTIDTVSITAIVGRKLAPEEFSVQINRHHCSVALKDGRQMSLFLYGEVLDGHEAQMTKSRLKLTFRKATANHWPELVTDNPLLIVNGTATLEEMEVTNGNDLEATRIESAMLIDCNGNNDNNALLSTSPPPPPPADLPVSNDIGSQAQPTNLNGLNRKVVESQGQGLGASAAAVCAIPHLKHDFYEKGHRFESLCVNAYVKNINRETVKVRVRESTFALVFQTTDKAFLSLYAGTDEHTTFEWSINVMDDLLEEGFLLKTTPSKVEIALQKKSPRKWNGLERPAGQDAKRTPNGVSLTSLDVNMSDQPIRGDRMMSSSYLSPPGVSRQRLNGSATSEVSQPPSPALLSPVASPAVSPTTVPSPLSVDSPSKKVSGRFEMRHSPGSQSQSQDAKLPAEHLESNKDDTADGGGSSVSPSGSPVSAARSLQRASEIGYTGLANLGNTCFMNSVLQVLFNTVELREYFVGGRYKAELNSSNPLGFKGILASAFSVLMKHVWSGSYGVLSPSEIKSIVASRAPQFHGYLQHDAQEFMEFLLDGIHEDLNRIRNKPYTQMIDSDNRPDEVVAVESWLRHKLRNDSIIVDLFHGLLKSRLVCPDCQKVSITFDPFMVLPVPLPGEQRTVHVTYMYRHNKRPVKMLMSATNLTSVGVLKDRVIRRLSLSNINVKILQIHDGAVHSVLGLGDKLPDAKTLHLLMCETILSKDVGESVAEIVVIQKTMCPCSVPLACHLCSRPAAGSVLKRCSRCFSVAYCNVECQTKDWPRHKTQCHDSPEVVGQPFVISLPASRATFAAVHDAALAYASYSVDWEEATPSSSRTSVSSRSASIDWTALQESGDDPLSPLVKSNGSLNRMDSTDLSAAAAAAKLGDAQADVVNGNGTTTPSASEMAAQLLPFNIRPSNNNGQRKQGTGGSKLIDLGEEPISLTSAYYVLEWRNHPNCKGNVKVTKKALDCDDLDKDASSSSSNMHSSFDLSLMQCLNLFTEPEILSKEHAWYCPKCKDHKQASKQLSVWSLPDLFVVQFKRFSFRSILTRDKLDKFVAFPTRGLDLSAFCMNGRQEAGSAVYDLYAVVNHHGGGVSSGHYTTFARCASLPQPDADGGTSIDEVGWRHMDDGYVCRVSESEVVTRDAYVLFYRRRHSKPATHSTSHVTVSTSHHPIVNCNGSTANGTGDHDSNDENDVDIRNGNVTTATGSVSKSSLSTCQPVTSSLSFSGDVAMASASSSSSNSSNDSFGSPSICEPNTDMEVVD